MVKMSHLASRKPRQLSGGQQQRVALARALVNRPSVLLLDEPLGALDRKLREEMQIELKLLQTQLGITFIFVTHDQEEAMSMSDRIAIMLDGHIEQLGDPETVYERPTSAFVAGFVGRNNFWRGTGSADGVVADDGTVFKVTRPEEKVEPGEGAIAAVRPECFRLDTTDPGRDVNVLPGVVASVAHFGDVLQYVVTAGQREIIVLTPRASGSPPGNGRQRLVLVERRRRRTSSPTGRPTWSFRRRWRDKNRPHQREHQPPGGLPMTNPDRPMRVLMSTDTARHLGTELSRRRLFGIAGSAALAAFLASCGDDDDATSAATAAPGTAAPAGTGGATATTAAAASGDSGANSFKLFTWAEYDDPDVMSTFGNIEITIFNSNEEAIQKLVTAGGNGGYDMMCPTGAYIPQLVGENLLEPLDLSRITNFKNLDPAYTNQAWDPGNKYSICKDWGSTGWIYDKTVINREITTWSDFIDVAMNEASGNVVGARCPRRPDRHLLLGERHRLDDHRPGAACRRARTSWSTSSQNTSRPSTRTPASTSRRATTRSRRRGTATPAKDCSRSRRREAILPTTGMPRWLLRRPSSGWTTGSSSRTPPTSTPPTTS